MNVFFIFLTQLIYSLSDLGKKIALNSQGFRLDTLKNPLFILGSLLPLAGFIIQMYVFSRYELSRTISLLGAFAIIFSVILGVAVLKERLTILNYIGVLFAIIAIILVKHK